MFLCKNCSNFYGFFLPKNSYWVYHKGLCEGCWKQKDITLPQNRLHLYKDVGALPAPIRGKKRLGPEQFISVNAVAVKKKHG